MPSEPCRDLASPPIVRAPLCFGGADRGLFGWYHAPAPGTAARLAILICPPLGHEYINSHRAMRHLADEFARAGLPTLRLDYHGTGDSAGRDELPNQLDAWLESIRDGAAVLRAESGCAEIGLAGLRMGATLAALASRDLEAACLVMWAPCITGRGYVREMIALSRTVGAAGSETRPTGLEVAGFVLTEEMQRELSAISLADTPPKARRILLVSRDDLPASPGPGRRWLTAGISVRQVTLPGYADMLVVPHHTKVPEAAISAIVEWTAAELNSNLRTLRPRVDIRVENRSWRRGQLRFDAMCESPIHFGEDNSMFGIVCQPARSAGRESPVVLIPNAGSTHHVGPGRMYVQLARRLAQLGMTSLRFDLPGLGDSVMGNVNAENRPYPDNATELLATTMDALSERIGARRFVIMGLCSGAHAGFHAAMDLDRHQIVESVLINPLTFYYVPGMPLDAPDSVHLAQWQRYRRSIGSLRGWSKLLRDDTDFRRIAADVAERARITARKSADVIQAWATAHRGGETTRLATDITRVAERGRTLTFVFSRFDPGHDQLMIDAGRVVKLLCRRGQARIVVIEGANHTFDSSRARHEMIESIATLLSRRYAAF